MAKMIFANEVNLNKLKKTKNSNRNVGVFYVVPLGLEPRTTWLWVVQINLWTACYHWPSRF